MFHTALAAQTLVGILSNLVRRDAIEATGLPRGSATSFTVVVDVCFEHATGPTLLDINVPFLRHPGRLLHLHLLRRNPLQLLRPLRDRIALQFAEQDSRKQRKTVTKKWRINRIAVCSDAGTLFGTEAKRGPMVITLQNSLPPGPVGMGTDLVGSPLFGTGPVDTE